MIPFLVIAVVMLTIACAWVLVPLLSRRREATIEGEAANLSVLRDQRAELEADLANGVLSSEQYEAARMDLERRVLEEAAGRTAGVAATSHAGARTAALMPKNMPSIDSFRPMTLDFANAAGRVEDVTMRLAQILGL